MVAKEAIDVLHLCELLFYIYIQYIYNDYNQVPEMQISISGVY